MQVEPRIKRVIDYNTIASPALTAVLPIFLADTEADRNRQISLTDFKAILGVTALETISGQFWYVRSNAAQTIATGTTPSTMIFNTAVNNTGTAYNTATGEWTAPLTGYINLAAGLNSANALWAVNNVWRIAVYIDGAVAGFIGEMSMQAAATFAARVKGGAPFSVTAGQVVTLRVMHTQGGDVATSGTQTTDYMRITYTGIE